MARNGRFWRNVTLIALAHVALILGLIRWSLAARNSANGQSVVWLNGAQDLPAGEAESEASAPAAVSPAPSEPEPPKTEEANDERPVVTEAKSEIELPTRTPRPTPTATATPRLTSTPTPKSRSRGTTPKPTPKATPKKAVLAKVSPKLWPKPKPTPTKLAKNTKKAGAETEKKKLAKTAPAKTELQAAVSSPPTGSGGKAGHEGGASRESEFGWYGNMLHDRFYSAWIQPTTNIASGATISTIVKVRIEKDGRVSSFEIIKPSQNVVVNESVTAIAKRITEVDPPPPGLSNGDHYDVNINFELNTDQETAK